MYVRGLGGWVGAWADGCRWLSTWVVSCRVHLSACTRTHLRLQGRWWWRREAAEVKLLGPPTLPPPPPALTALTVTLGLAWPMEWLLLMMPVPPVLITPPAVCTSIPS